MDSTILDSKWVKYLQEKPETGMGYQHVAITMNDDSRVEGTVLNCEHLLLGSDFPIAHIKAIEVQEGWAKVVCN